MDAYIIFFFLHILRENVKGDNDYEENQNDILCPAVCCGDIVFDRLQQQEKFRTGEQYGANDSRSNDHSGEWERDIGGQRKRFRQCF